MLDFTNLRTILNFFFAVTEGGDIFKSSAYMMFDDNYLVSKHAIKSQLHFGISGYYCQSYRYNQKCIAYVT